MSRRTALVAAQLLLAAWAVPSSAQMTFGVKAGASLATLKIGNDTNSAKPFIKRKVSYAAGAYLGLGSGMIGLQLEALYVQKGAKLNAASAGVTGAARVTYAEPTALLRLAFGPDKTRIFLLAGGAAGIELKCELEVTQQGASQTQTCDEASNSAPRRKLDFSAVGGAGVKIGMGGLGLTLEGRYVRGLQTLDKGSNPQDIKNEAIYFLAGIAIALGSKK